MGFEMYGPEASPGRLIEQDNQTAALRRAQVRQLDAATSKVEQDIEQEKRFTAAMRTAAASATPETGPPMSMSGQLERAASEALKAGLPDQGAKLATNAALLRQRESAASENKAQEQTAVLTLQTKRLEALSRIVGNVKDQASWDEANAIYAKTFGSVSPYAGQPYDPAFVGQLQGATTTAAQRARLKLQEADTMSKDRERRSREAFREFRKELSGEELALKEAREERLGKNGGKQDGGKGPAVGSPVKAETDEAARTLKAAYPNWPKEELATAAYAMASRARGLRRANKALEPKEALAQAFEEAKTNGAYEVVDGLFKDTTRVRQDKLTRTPMKPAAPINKLPTGARQIGTSKGKPVYETPDGKRFIGE